MTNQSKRINYLDPSFEMDFTNLERLPTTTGIPLIDRLNAELNEQSELLEDIFIEIACINIDHPRKCAFYKEHSRMKGHSTGNSNRIPLETKIAIKELIDENRFTLSYIAHEFGVSISSVDNIKREFEAPSHDDFDADNADYLAIQEEVNNNPRD